MILRYFVRPAGGLWWILSVGCVLFKLEPIGEPVLHGVQYSPAVQWYGRFRFRHHREYKTPGAKYANTKAIILEYVYLRGAYMDR